MTRVATPSRTARSRPVSRLLAAAMAVAVACPPLPAQAQKRGGGLPLIRDAEIEQLMRDYTQPILRAAGLGKVNVKIVLINDRSFNAFVVDGRRIFVNTGALARSTTPNQIIGVMAHEAGHISGGHLSDSAGTGQCADRGLIGMLLGAAAIAAGSAAGGGAASGAGQAGMAAIMGSQHAAQRTPVLPARARGSCRPRCGKVSRSDRPIRERDVRDLQALRR